MDKLHSCSYDDDELKEWHGIPLFRNIFYIYLYHKYKQPCVAVGKEDVALVICQPHIKISKECYLNMNNNVDIIIKIRNCIKQYKVETLLIPVSLIYVKCNGKTGRHANLLLYRKFNNTIEVFEPNGQMPFSSDFVEVEYIILCKKINDNLPSDKQVTLVHNTQICPNLPGLQEMEGMSKIQTDHEWKGGYCVAWSMYFGELVLKNPTKTSEQILENIHTRLANLRVGENDDEEASYEDKANYLLRLIRGYVYYISEIIEGAMWMLFTPGMTCDQYNLLDNKDNLTKDEEDLMNTVNIWEKDFLKINMDLFENGQDTVLERLKYENPDKYEKYEKYISQYLQPFSEAKSDSKEGSTSSSSSSSTSPSLLQKRNNDDMNDDDTTDNKKARPGPGGGYGCGGGRLKKTKTKKTKKKKTKKKKTKRCKV